MQKQNRVLKKFQMRGVEERGMRRTFLYAAMTRNDDDNADGKLEATFTLSGQQEPLY